MKTKVTLLAFAALMLFSIQTNAQGYVLGKIKSAATNRIDQKIDESINNGLDSITEGENGIFTNKKKKQATTGQKPQNENENEQEPVAAPAAKQTSAPTLQAYSKFDFIPGEKVIFFDDFSQDAVGDFPALWFSNGSGEVVTLNNYPGKWLAIMGDGCYYPERDLATTENFTAEFDMICNFEEGNNFPVGFYLVSGNISDPNEGGAIPGVAGVKTTFSPWDIAYAGYKDGVYTIDGKNEYPFKPGEKVHLSYWIQKQRLRVYINEKKVIDAPRAIPAGFKYNILRFEVSDSKPLISNFRVAAGLPDTRNKLITEGKLVTYGIYFDVNKDVVKPESYGTLKDIAATLNEVPDLKVKIVGHTDSDGADAANLDLSKRRAASVKNELVKSFGVKGDRLITDGMGESQGIAPNDTPANKAINRRVEFLKM